MAQNCKAVFYAAYRIIQRLEADKTLFINDDEAEFILKEIEKLHAATCEDCQRKLKGN